MNPKLKKSLLYKGDEKRYSKQRSNDIEETVHPTFVAILRTIMPSQNGTPEQFEAMQASIERGKELVDAERGRRNESR